MSTTKNHARTHSDNEAHNNVEEECGAFTEQFLTTDFERRLALHTARNHRHHALVVVSFHASGHSDWIRGDTCGLKSESDRQKDEAVPDNLNRQRRNRSCKNNQQSGQARKTVLADLSQKKSSATPWNVKQTRDTDMLAYGCARTRVTRNTRVSYLLRRSRNSPCPAQ